MKKAEFLILIAIIIAIIVFVISILGILIGEQYQQEKAIASPEYNVSVICWGEIIYRKNVRWHEEVEDGNQTVLHMIDWIGHSRSYEFDNDKCFVGVKR